MKLIALYDIAVKGRHCAAGLPFEAEGEDARYLLGSKAAIKAPVETEEPMPTVPEPDVEVATLSLKSAPIAETATAAPTPRRRKS